MLERSSPRDGLRDTTPSRHITRTPRPSRRPRGSTGSAAASRVAGSAHRTRAAAVWRRTRARRRPTV